MQDWMRKHRRFIMFFVLIFIGVPFVFMFGSPSGCGRRQQAGGHQNIEARSVAQVGGVPILESEYRRALDRALAPRRQQGGESVSYRDLDQDGTAQLVMDGLIDQALLRLVEGQRRFKVDRELMIAEMQKWDMFQTEDGEFNHEAWNEWVGSVARWNEIFDSVGAAMTQQVYLNTVAAPARRILSSEVNDELKADHVKMRVKYMKLEPAVHPTEEALRSHYDENPDAYRLPEKVKLEMMLVSLSPTMPELAPELVERARNNEDFAQLATEYSSLAEPVGGELGWRTLGDFTDEHLKPLFALNPGEVSDPILGPAAYFIYKNEEERVNEETGEREVFGRQIVLNATLTAEERMEREARADALLDRLQGGEDAAAIAEEEGLTLEQTNFFDRTTEQIDYVDDSDVPGFRAQGVTATDDEWKQIRTRTILYLVHAVDREEGALPPFEEVRDDAVDKVIAAEKVTEEYREQVRVLADQIKEQAGSLEEAKTKFPELDAPILEIDEGFTRKDSLFQHQIYVQASQVYESLKDVAPGTLVGPVTGMLQDTWFFELIDRVEPSEEELAALGEEREDIEKRIKQMSELELFADFTKDMRERMLAKVVYTQDTELLDAILGRNEEEDEGEANDLLEDESIAIDLDSAEEDAAPAETAETEEEAEEIEVAEIETEASADSSEEPASQEEAAE